MALTSTLALPKHILDTMLIIVESAISIWLLPDLAAIVETWPHRTVCCDTETERETHRQGKAVAFSGPGAVTC